MRKAISGALRRVGARLSAFGARLLARSLRIAGWVLILGSVEVFWQNPDHRDLDAAVIVMVASLLGLALSIAFAATLLVAQHMSERHARSVLVEFRRDRSWPFLLGLLALSVCLTVAAALQQPTMSTGWSSFLLLVGVFLLAADRYPSLLDTLDPARLTTRMSDRVIGDLQRAARSGPPWEQEKNLVAILLHGVEQVAGVGRQAIKSEDPEVLHAALDGLRRQLAAYMKSVPLISVEDVAADFTLQRLEVIAQMTWETSTVVMLPVVVEEVRRIGLDAAGIVNPLNRDWEPLTGRICDLLGEIATQSVGDDRSAAPGLAASAMGDVARQLVRSGRPLPAGQHVRRLEALAVGTIGSSQSIVSMQAVHALAEIADEAARSLVLGEAADLYEKACGAVIATASAYRAKHPKTWGRADYSVLPVMGPMAYPNVASLLLVGIAAQRVDEQASDYVPGYADFAAGAAGLFELALGMAFDQAISPVIRSDAGMAVYSAFAGLMVLSPSSDSDEHEDQDLLETMWPRYVTAFVESVADRKSNFDDPWRFATLLLFALYNAGDLSSPPAGRLLGLVRISLADLRPGQGRVDVDAMWRTVGVAALAIGAKELAAEVARQTPPPPPRDAARPWRVRSPFFEGSRLSSSFAPAHLMRGVPHPKWLAAHEDAELQREFLAMIDQQRPRPAASGDGKRRAGRTVSGPRPQPASSRRTS